MGNIRFEDAQAYTLMGRNFSGENFTDEMSKM